MDISSHSSNYQHLSSVETEAEIHPPASAGGPAIKKAGPSAEAGYPAGCRIVNRMPNPLVKTNTIW